MVTLNERESQSTVQSDVFGLWSIELPINAIARVVFGNISKTFAVPDKSIAGLNELPEYQPAAAQHDSFGYPFPREGV